MLRLPKIRNVLLISLLSICVFLTATSSSQAADAFSPFYWKGSYGRDMGTAPINNSYARNPTALKTGCRQADYPKHVGARCYRKETCSDREGGGKKWGYNFDDKTTCWRKKDCTGCGVPKSYPAPSQAEFIGCLNNKEQIGTLCYDRCKSGTNAGTAGLDQTRCYDKRNGKCPQDKEESGSLCYTSCRSGYSGEGPVCYSTTPDKYVACGAGFAKSKNECTWITLDMTMAGAQVGFLLTSNLVAMKSARAARLSKALAATDLKSVEKLWDAARVVGKTSDDAAALKRFQKLESVFGNAKKMSPNDFKDTKKVADEILVNPEKWKKFLKASNDISTMIKQVAVQSKSARKAGAVAGSAAGATWDMVDSIGPSGIFPKDPWDLTRTIAQTISFLHAIVDFACLFPPAPPATASNPALCGAIQSNESQAFAATMDVIGAYTFPIYGQNNPFEEKKKKPLGLSR